MPRWACCASSLKNLVLDLQTLTEEAARLYGDKLTNANVVDDVIDFMLGRFRAWYQDEGYTVDTIQAVLARRPTRPADFDARMKAVSHFRTLEEASALAAANKRVSNILAKATEPLNDIVHASVLKEAAEVSWPDIWLCCVISFSRTLPMVVIRKR